jgi:uncharacterized protein (TIGR02145 family)
MKFLKLKKLGILGIITLFGISTFISNYSISSYAASSSSILPIAKGGTNANNAESAQINLGRVDTISSNSTDNEFPSSKAVYDYIKYALIGNLSLNNINFTSIITNWTGGDLIYKSSELSTTSANNKIKVGDKACTTSGQGYTSNSAAGDGVPQVGCVLPDLAAGIHTVTISTDGGASYKIKGGTVVYVETPALTNCDTTSMQTFGADAATCKAAMQQGQVIVLPDSRDNQKYRVKKMPDGNVWMVDNLKYGGSSLAEGYCSSSGKVWAHNPGSFTGCGCMYNWSTALTISPSGWSLHPNSGAKSAYELNAKMLAAADDSTGNRNPVYSTTDYLNFGEGGTGNPAPWLGVYVGYSIGGSIYLQSSYAYYWSATENSNNAYFLTFTPVYVDAQYSNLKTYGLSARSVL